MQQNNDDNLRGGDLLYSTNAKKLKHNLGT